MRFEYKVFSPLIGKEQKALNELGMAGWELVSSSYYGGYTFVLKRKIRSYLEQWADDVKMDTESAKGMKGVRFSCGTVPALE